MGKTSIMIRSSKFLPGFSHSRCSRSSCRHLLNFGPWPLWTFWTWLATDNHLATIMPPSPSEVDAADQYTWLLILFTHFPITSQSFCFDKAESFFFIPNKSKPRGIQHACILLLEMTFYESDEGETEQQGCARLVFGMHVPWGMKIWEIVYPQTSISSLIRVKR